MKFSLQKYHPKPKKLGNGDLYMGNKKDAQFFEDATQENSRILASMEGVTIEWVGADAMKLAGFEHVGFDKQNCKKFIYQEWYLRKAAA